MGTSGSYFFGKYEAGVGAFLCKKESGRLSKIDGKMALWGKGGGIIIGLGKKFAGAIK